MEKNMEKIKQTSLYPKRLPVNEQIPFSRTNENLTLVYLTNYILFYIRNIILLTNLN